MPRASPYSPLARKQAAVAVMAHGTSKAASKVCGVPASTIRDWRNNDPAFAELLQDAQTEFSEQLQAQLTQIIELAHTNVLDRLRRGDEQVNARTGERVRVPVRGKDCAIIAAVAIDKLRIIQGQPTRITETVDLAALAERFQAIAQGRGGPDSSLGNTSREIPLPIKRLTR